MDKLRLAGEAQAKAADGLRLAGEAQAKSTKALANNSGKQIAALTETAEATRVQAISITKQADATVVASKATDRLAFAGQAQSAAVLQSLDLAKESNGISLRASLAADRPWVGALMPGDITPQAGTDYVAMFTVSNTGRSPALYVTANLSLDIFDIKENIVELASCASPCQIATLFPSSPLAYHPTIIGAKMTAAEVEMINNRRDVVVLRTRFDYTDSVGSKHHTWSCSYYAPKIGFTSCPFGNRAD